MPEEQTPNQNQEKRVRLVRPSLVLLCGPAACGKSTFAERHFRPTQIIASDWARARICDDERDQRFQAPAFALVHYLTEIRLGLNRLCVVDSTALTANHRKEYLELAKRFRVPCVVFLFDVPLEKCIERDQGRQRTVGRPVVERQYSAFDQTKAAIRQEGFDEIIELRDEDLDKVQIEIIFRPIAQAAVTPVLRPQVTNRQAPHPWQQATGRGSVVGGAKPFPTTQPAASSAAPVKPATRPGIASSNAPSALTTGLNDARSHAASPAPAVSSLSSSQGKTRTTASEAAAPPAKPLVKPDDQNPG
jgi:protein phosphatase